MNTASLQLEECCRHLDICNSAIDDTTVTDKIKRECPAHTYSWLFVRTLGHHFMSISGKALLPSRMVQFKPTGLESAKNLLSIIFQTTTIETLNINRVVLGLLGSKDQRDQKFAKAAYWQNYTITMYFSTEGSLCADFQSEQEVITKKFVGSCTLL